MNGVSGIDGRSTTTNRPRSNFIFANREKADVTERLVEQPCQNVDRGFIDPQRFQKLGAFGGISDLRDLGLELGAQGTDLVAGPGDFGLSRCKQRSGSENSTRRS